MENQSGTILKKIFARKLKLNPRYSKRAFARDIQVSPAFLTNLLLGKRSLSVQRAEQIADRLNLDPRAKRSFLKSVVRDSTQQAHLLEEFETTLAYQDIQLDQFQFFNNWYYVALLELVTCRDFKADPVWMSARLGISAAQAYSTFDSLIRLGLVRKKNGVFKKTNAHINVPTQTNGENVVVNFHRQMLEKAREALADQTPETREKRHISGITMSVDISKIAEAKAKIERFKLEMSELLTEGEANEVLQLNVQLIPLSK